MRMIAAASRATSVPELPIANPTSAFFNAGASFVPSPVTATTFPLSLRPVTKQYLSQGLDLAKTSSLSFILSNSSPFAIVSTLASTPSYSAFFELIGQSHTAVRHFLQTTPPTSLLKSGPSIEIKSSPSLVSPIYFAIALAVIILSPVTILTVIPALLHFLIASGTSFLGMSLTPMIARSMMFSFQHAKTPFSSFNSISSCADSFLQPRQRVLKEFYAIFVITLFNFQFISGTIASISPV